MVRILANENVPRQAIEALRTMGHDVVWVRTDAPGTADPPILTRAVQEGHLLLSFDKDFGDLAFQARLPASCGVVLCRFRTPSPERAADVLCEALASRTDWAGYFSVIEDFRIRMTSLPRR